MRKHNSMRESYVQREGYFKPFFTHQQLDESVVVFIGIPPITVFDKNGLSIQFSFDMTNLQSSNVFTVTMTAKNSRVSPMTDFVFQAAVPKV